MIEGIGTRLTLLRLTTLKLENKQTNKTPEAALLRPWLTDSSGLWPLRDTKSTLNIKFTLIYWMRFPNCGPRKQSLNRKQQSCHPSIRHRDFEVWDYWSSRDLHLRAPEIRALRREAPQKSASLSSWIFDWVPVRTLGHSEGPSKEWLLWDCELNGNPREYIVLGHNGRNASKPGLRPQKSHGLAGGLLRP